jgi:hypothetical protein
MGEDAGSEIGRNRCIMTGIFLLASSVVLEYFPEKHGVMAPSFVVF